MIHELKCDCSSFACVDIGAKAAEFRTDDRPFARDDVVILREWSADGSRYTGPALAIKISHVSRGNPIPDGCCMISLDRTRIRFTIPIDTPPYRG